MTEQAEPQKFQRMPMEDWEQWLFSPGNEHGKGMGPLILDTRLRDNWERDGFLDEEGYLTELARQWWHDMATFAPRALLPTAAERRMYQAGGRRTIIDGFAVGMPEGFKASMVGVAKKMPDPPTEDEMAARRDEALEKLRADAEDDDIPF